MPKPKCYTDPTNEHHLSLLHVVPHDLSSTGNPKKWEKCNWQKGSDREWKDFQHPEEPHHQDCVATFEFLGKSKKLNINSSSDAKLLYTLASISVSPWNAIGERIRGKSTEAKNLQFRTFEPEQLILTLLSLNSIVSILKALVVCEDKSLIETRLLQYAFLIYYSNHSCSPSGTTHIN